MHHFLAIDLGASSGRGILATLDKGRMTLEEVHRFENGGMDVNGRLVWNILGLFSEIKQAIREALKRGVTLSGIAVDTWGVDFVLLDRDGHFLAPPLHYRDSHTADVFDWVFDIVSKEDFYGRTGIQFMPFNTIFQLATMKKERFAALELADTLLLIPNALTYLLSGDISAEFSIATTTQAYDPVAKDWAWDIIDRLGLPRTLFPKIVPSCVSAGHLRPAVCDELNCEPIPVLLVGGHDTASAVAAVPAVGDTDDWAFLSSGTWSLLGMELDSPCLTQAAFEANFTNEGCIDGKTRFLKNIMGLWLVQESRNTWKRQGQTYSFAELEDMARNSAPFKALINPNDERFMAPGDMPERVRQYCDETGQPAPETPGEIVRCIAESLALTYRYAIDQMEHVTGRSIAKLHLVGGGGKDGMLNAFTANAINRPVIAGPIEATATGNIIGQALAVGAVKDLAEGRRIVSQSFEMTTFTPDDTAAWEAAYRRYKALINVDKPDANA
ncbi:MAG: FGGY-family carbohydrate kinase [Lentisphaeria bacterium]|nr:FGGY-family carbohydrate kinase [Lentisphaeria bacterium]